MSDQEIDEEKLTAVYKYILHEEVPEDDNYKKAMKLLKLGFVEWVKNIKVTKCVFIRFNYRLCASKNDKDGAVLVQRTIEQYRDVVDKEDYYADCREKYKHIVLPDLSKRPEPSKLLETDPKVFIGEPLPCAGKYEYCKEMEITDEDLKSFCIYPKDEKDIDFDFDELESSIEMCISDIKSQKESSSTSEKSEATSEKESKTTSSSLLNEFPKPSFSKQVSINKDLPFNFNRSPQPCSSKSVDQNMDSSEDSLNDKKSTLKQSNLNSMFFKPQINRAPSSTVSSVSKEIPIVKKRKLSPPPPPTAPKNNLYPDFKSSLEELHLQNAKQNKNPAQQSSSYQPNPAAVMRKSVGLSKPFKVPLEAQQTSAPPEPEQTKWV